MTVNDWGSPPLKDDFHWTLALVTSQSNWVIFGSVGFPANKRKIEKQATLKLCFVSTYTHLSILLKVYNEI